MRFLADMGISPMTAEFLRQLGHDAIHLYEQGLERLPDATILEKARVEEFVVLTNDLDFGELLAITGSRLPSVIIFRLRDMRPANVNKHVQIIVEQHSELLKAGVIMSVNEKRIRARKLPIQ